MGPSPLRIESYYLRRLEYKLKEEFESGALQDLPDSIDPKIQVDVGSARHDKKENDWRIVINVRGGEEPEFPYTFNISFVGFFRVADNFPKDKQETLVTVNGPSILFAAAREFLSIVTARSPYPPIMLPSISFVPERTDQTGKKKPAKPKSAKAAKHVPRKKATK